MDQEGKQVGIIILAVIGGIILIGGGLFAWLVLSDSNEVNSNTNTPVIVNEVVNENTNTTINTNVTTTEKVEFTGRVFTKGYGTPSESFGILTTTGLEVGLGSYDSMREQIRAYIGENINVTLSKVCTSSNDDCCRTLFPLCGEVISWDPIEE